MSSLPVTSQNVAEHHGEDHGEPDDDETEYGNLQATTTVTSLRRLNTTAGALQKSDTGINITFERIDEHRCVGGYGVILHSAPSLSGEAAVTRSQLPC